MTTPRNQPVTRFLRCAMISMVLALLAAPVLILCSSAGMADPNPAADTSSTQTIQKTLDTLRAIGAAEDSAHGGGEALRQACALAQERGAQALSQAISGLSYNTSSGMPYVSGIESSIFSQGNSSLNQALGSGCAALTGQGGGSAFNAGQLKNAGITMALAEGNKTLKSLVAPFVKRFELSTGYDGGHYTWEALTVVPLWHDDKTRNHLFTQLSWNHQSADGDTINAGLALRHLNEAHTAVYGVNGFFDHGVKMGHNRMSLGADMQMTKLGLSANRYFPVSGWKSVDAYWEERAASGWDLELQGRLPQWPSWQANLRGYGWSSDSNGNQRDVLGYDTTVLWKPINIVEIEAGVRNEELAPLDFHALLRLVYRFGDTIEAAAQAPTRLETVDERVYDKVRRDNHIRTERRVKDSAMVTVTETAGANSAVTATGTVSLAAGQTLAEPLTVTIASAAGSEARLRFYNGGILTIGAGSSVRVEATVITLLSGLFQYVSGSTNVTINVPGGTVTLLGTDVDVSSNGTTSVLRVRDGQARLTGTASGSVTLATGQTAETVSGAAVALASSVADAVNHADDVSTKIDRVASAQSGGKIAPYSVAAPRLTATSTSPGQPITVGLQFNQAVTVSGGPPRLSLMVNGNTRQAALSGGSGTVNLSFTYTLQAGDSGASSVTVQSLDLNGGTITGDAKPAVTTFAPATLNLSGSIADVTAPSGYAVAFTTSPVTAANYTAVAFQITGAEVGTTYNYSISSSGGGTPVTGSGTIATATQNVTGIDLSSLPDGTLTVSLTLTDTASNTGAAATNTATKNVVTLSMDFTTGTYSLNGTSYGAVTSIPGWSFSRASPATTYAEDSSGNLVAFAANTPRITDKGLLVEGSATNLLTYAVPDAALPTNWSSFPSGTWSRTVVTSSKGLTGIRFQTTVGRANLNQNVTLSPNTTYTLSAYVEAAFGCPTGGGGALIEIRNFSDATGATGANCSASTANQRVYFTFTTGSDTTGTVLYGAGVDGNSTADLTVSGIQLEAGSFPSSYIPTTTASVTRSADVASIGSVVGLNYPLSMSAQFERTVGAGASAVILATANTSNDVSDIQVNSGGNPALFSAAGGTQYADISVGAVMSAGTTAKMAGRIATNNAQAARDGALGTQATSVTLPANPNQIRLGSNSSGTQPANSYIKHIAVYPTAKSDPELQTLTQ